VMRNTAGEFKMALWTGWTWLTLFHACEAMLWEANMLIGEFEQAIEGCYTWQVEWLSAASGVHCSTL
jgi:hypothetical protein